MPKQSIEDTATQWISEEYYQYKNKPLSTNVSNQYIKALLDIAGADGTLTELERKWVLSYAAARVTQNQIDVLNKYKLGSENSTAIFNDNSQSKIAEYFQTELIYDGLRAASADGSLKLQEIDAISVIAKDLGMSDEQFQELLAFYKEEEELRQKRITFLFPTSYSETVKTIDSHYER